ncbi:MAG: hypothetical protein H0M93_04220 [Methanophagales archaeon]|nr:hypothetical protein [Methanophagales archaeon]
MNPNYKIIIGKVSIKSVDDFLQVLRSLANKHTVTIQAMDAGLIACEEHIISAVKKAVRAIDKKNSITSDLGLEILLYAAGKRQIERALAMGVKEGERRIVIVVVDHDVGLGSETQKDLEVVAKEVKLRTEMDEESIQDWKRNCELELDKNADRRNRLKHFFGITDEELKAVGEKKLRKLVLERVALLDLLK